MKDLKKYSFKNYSEKYEKLFMDWRNWIGFGNSFSSARIFVIVAPADRGGGEVNNEG